MDLYTYIFSTSESFIKMQRSADRSNKGTMAYKSYFIKIIFKI